MEVKVLFLGGVGEIGKNITALEYQDEIIIIDCGLAFPNDDMPGIDVVIPNFEYITQNKQKLKAVVLTHGHEDHIGALPYFLKEFDVPVYGTNLTLALVQRKLNEHKINAKLNIVKPRDVVKFNHFSVEFIKVCHSVAGSCALSISTPSGKVFHTGDFKIDFTPVDNVGTDLSRIAEIGGEGVALLLSESTNVEREGFAMSESKVGDSLASIFNEHKERRIFIATFSSNTHRLQQIVQLAKQFKRKICFSGRSMINIAECARSIGELSINSEDIIEIDRVNKMDDRDVMILTTGSQGEPMSALTRMAADDFNGIQIGANDTIIISASPIPGNEKEVYSVINALYKKGAKVIYESIAEIHASGHAYIEELKLMHRLLKPKFFIPVHGEERHLIKHGELAEKMGIDQKNIRIPEIGSCIILGKEHLITMDNVVAGSVLVDGLGVGDVGEVVLKDRRQLSENGVIVAALTLDMANNAIVNIEVITRGYIYSKEYDDFTRVLCDIVRESIAGLEFKNNRETIKGAVRKDLRKALYKKTQRSPLIIPVIAEI